MLSFSTKELIKFSEKVFISGKEEIFEPSDFYTDTRLIHSNTNGVFIPIIGKYNNGHDFILNALNFGIKVIYLNLDEFSKYEKELLLFDKFSFWVLGVKDTIRLYQDLAKELLKKWNGFKIAITGSNGKTTVKEIVETILKERYLVLATKGNENNQLGVPKTIFQLKKDHQVIVIEMGAGKNGDILNLTDIVRPNIAVITNIGNSHSEFIGKDMMDIALEKRNIFSFLDKNDKAILDYNENFFSLLSENLKKDQCLSFDFYSHPEFKILKNRRLLGYQILYKGNKLNIKLIGEANLKNLHFALLISYQMNLTIEEINRGIEKILPIPMRLNVLKNVSYLILSDGYNSNLNSLKEGLKNFSQIRKKDFVKIVKHSYENFRKIIIISDILELNEIQNEITHQEIIQLLLSFEFDALFTIGFRMQKLAIDFEKYSKKNIFIKSFKPEEIELLYSFLKHFLIKGDTLYLKGARVFKLYEFSVRIIEEF